MKLIISHPTANANVRAVTMGLQRSGMLGGFYTSIASFPGDMLDKMSRFSLLSELRRRRFELSLKPFTHMHPWLETGRLISLKTGLHQLTKDEKGVFCIDAIYNELDKHVSETLCKKMNKDISAVYAYEDCALSTFTQAKKLGLKCIYDLPIAYWETGRSLMLEEADRLPNWKPTLGGGIQDSAKKLDRKSKEIELADMVITPSEFVTNSLPVTSRIKIVHMAPFGSPIANESYEVDYSNGEKKNKPLRVLFVGSMGQRKGLGDLFQAIRILKNDGIELVVMGSFLAPAEFYRKELPNFIYESGRPHEQVLALMRTCDVFCLPSIVEGRALVIQEAMSQGLPVIITANTGGEDLIQEGKTGFLVPIRSPEIIADRLEWFLENRDKIREMGLMAKRHANGYTWNNYSKSIADAIQTSF